MAPAVVLICNASDNIKITEEPKREITSILKYIPSIKMEMEFGDKGRPAMDYLSG